MVTFCKTAKNCGIFDESVPLVRTLQRRGHVLGFKVMPFLSEFFGWYRFAVIYVDRSSHEISAGLTHYQRRSIHAFQQLFPSGSMTSQFSPTDGLWVATAVSNWKINLH